MKRTITILAAAMLAAWLGSPVFGADVACGSWERTPDPSGPMQMEQTTIDTTIFDTVPGTGGAGEEQQTFAVCSPTAVLKMVIISSTTCTDCDIVVKTRSADGGEYMVYAEDGAAAATVDNISYAIYSAALVGAPAFPEQGGTGGTEYLAYVKIVNNDAVARNVEVTLFWSSE